MRKILFVSLLFFSLLSLNAQSKSKKLNYYDIKRDTTYYWGMNAGLVPQEEALVKSMDDLYVNIANNCVPDALYATNDDQHVHLVNIIKTFENKIREKMIQVPLVEDFEDDEYSYFVYIKRSDFRNMCTERKAKIERLALRGYNSENDENLQLEDALKSYYWGMMLCLAHPYGNSLKVSVDGETVMAYTWFIDRIDGAEGVLKSFSFILPKENAVEETEDETIVTLNVRSTFGMPISNLQFQYYNGQKYIPTSVNDGRAVLMLTNYDKSSVSIKIEYEFLTESTIDPEVHKVLNSIKHNIKFKNTKQVIEINSADRKNEQKHAEDVSASSINLSDVATIANSEWRKIDDKFDVNDPEYTSIMQEVEKALRAKNYYSVKHHFTEEGFGMLDTLSRYGNMFVVGKQEYSFIKYENHVICRDINMQFNFRDNVSFNRDVVFRFNSTTKKIESIAFRLSDVTENDIVSKTKWPQEARLMLVNFLENYQTAYALKRSDYLESIYSDDALIIVGHVVKKTVIPDRTEFNLTEEEISLMQYDKNTYMNNLRRTFKSQGYINISFGVTDFTKTSSERDVYGVRLYQEYHSTTYGDNGYLFIMVDLTNGKPIIHVRAWQPEEVELEKLMELKDLRL